mmetsp:Transcript_26455/g.39277  ORF Transcript_26455/g.39277 Transcript_26455/m.39277 type:complete len:83 (+) Transcript_26455:125-373(+)
MGLNECLKKTCNSTKYTSARFDDGALKAPLLLSSPPTFLRVKGHVKGNSRRSSAMVHDGPWRKTTKTTVPKPNRRRHVRPRL